MLSGKIVIELSYMITILQWIYNTPAIKIAVMYHKKYFIVSSPDSFGKNARRLFI